MSIHFNKIATFLQIHKNASTSIKDAIVQCGFKLEQPRRGRIFVIDILAPEPRRCVRSRPFVFCFARNPFDRTVSWWEYSRHRWPKLEPYASMTFGEWVRAGVPDHWRKRDHAMLQSHPGSPLLQCNVIQDWPMQFVGRFETLPYSFDVLLDFLKGRCALDVRCDFRYRLKQLRSSKRRATSSYYTSETETLLYERLRRDFQRFGYGRVYHE